MMEQRITHAVLPIAGRGTRLEPATLSIPKALAPLANRCLLDYAVAEARMAGVDAFVLVASSADLPVLQRWLGGCAELDGATTQVVVQSSPRGLGHAIAQARSALPAGASFAVLTPDDVILDEGAGALARMCEAWQGLWQGLGAAVSMVALERVPLDQTHRYGVLDADEPDARGLTCARGFVEKPPPGTAPSRLAAVGRYLLPFTIFDALEQVAPGAGGEIQITDAIAHAMPTTPLYGFAFPGRRLDCGEPIGYVLAQAACALARDDLSAPVRAGLEQLLTTTL